MRARIGALATSALLVLAGAAAAQDLGGYRDHKRVVLVFAPTAADPRLSRQRAELDRLIAPPDDRDLVRVEVVGAHVTGAGAPADRLRRRFGVPAGGFRVVLIGKDGGAKLTADQPVGAARLAAVIDAMPMRRDEMRRR